MKAWQCQARCSLERYPLLTCSTSSWLRHVYPRLSRVASPRTRFYTAQNVSTCHHAPPVENLLLGQAASLPLVRAHPWFMDRSNDESDNAVSPQELFGGRTVAMFGVPVIWGPGCTKLHAPGYLDLHQELSAVVDEVVCFSVADPYGMDAWRSALGAAEGSCPSFLADPTGALATVWGLEWDLTAFSAGIRCKRFSLLAVDGKVQAFNLHETPKNAASDAATLLAQAQEFLAC
jgi:peroxiredoxin